jgi:hypothetical protein
MPVEFINPSELSQGTYSHVAAVSAGSRTLYVSGQVAMGQVAMDADRQGRWRRSSHRDELTCRASAR